MDFSDAWPGTPKFSPDGIYCAASNGLRVTIRKLATLEEIRSFTCLDKIETLDWSPDSQYILCGLFRRGIVQVWSIDSPDWWCKIDPGPSGCSRAMWSPDSRHIITGSEFQIRLTVWSLVSKSISYLKYPKLNAKGLAFHSDGRYAAHLERRNCKDYVSIIACENWELIKNFPIETSDAQGLSWSPDNATLAVWDTVLEVGAFPPRRPTSHHPAHAISRPCGARTLPPAERCQIVAHSPLITAIHRHLFRQFLIIRSFLRTTTTITAPQYRVLLYAPTAAAWPSTSVPFTLPHCLPSTTTATSPSLSLTTARFPPHAFHHRLLVLTLVRPAAGPKPISAARGAAAPRSHPLRSRVELLPPGAIAIPVVRPSPDRPNPRLGVRMAEWSPDSRFLVSTMVRTHPQNMPTALWIWSVPTLRLHSVVLTKGPLRACKWNPARSRLAFCTGSQRLFMWDESGCTCVTVVPPNFHVQAMEWSADGRALVLADRDTHCFCFEGLPSESAATAAEAPPRAA
ncbi:putative WD-repeat protein [Paratrimastix pyriformis]|uniref:WD-repeat protein n=1 Tax=Paratrimastix pyriformis TaxID=342808 RepID=A0ABQ8UGU7_9EUKA|nr:putative WD-repeat protein [Paratrimastix pyriformis]